MSVIEKNISQFIQNQFPSIYREEGELFVEFVKQYYEWMEQPDNVLYHSRNLLDNKDIDETVDKFVVDFKEKYLADVQLDTVTQTRKLIKSSLDLYRSKGTERAVKLFFRSIFGVDADIYYPGDDIFRLSDGRWVKPKYIEVSDSEYNYQFVNKQIVGVTSGATAFVERFIRRKIKSSYINVLYISAISGEFQTDELISLPGQVLKGIPRMVGSTTTIDIIAGGADFNIGDIVSLESSTGVQGKARVADTTKLTGIVSFDLQDNGWGYTSDAVTLISEKVLSLQGVTTSSNTLVNEFNIFETVKQPAANLIFQHSNSSVGALANGTVIKTYYTNGAVVGYGKVLKSSQTNTITAFTANSTNVSSSADFINLVPCSYVNNDIVRYYVDTGNTVIGGLTNNATYYVVGANTVGIKLSSTYNGSAVNITASSLPETGHYIARYSQEVLASEITNTLGSVIQPTTNATGSVAVSSYVLSTTGKSATTLGSTTVTGTGTTYTSELIPGVVINLKYYNSIISINANTAGIDSTAEAIKIASANTKLQVGDKVLYLVPTGNTAITGLSNNTSYYVTFANSSAIAISASSGGSNVDLTEVRTGTTEIHTLTNAVGFKGEQTTKVAAVATSTSFTLADPATYNSSNVYIQVQDSKSVYGTTTNFTSLVYGTTLAFYTNSTNFVLKTVNAVTNATYMTIQEGFDYVNSSANYAPVTSNSSIFIDNLGVANSLSGLTISRTDKSATGNVIGVSSNLYLYATNMVSGFFSNNEIVYQLDSAGKEIANAYVISASEIVGTNASYSVANSIGVFKPLSGNPLRSRYANGLATTKTSTLKSMDMKIGVYNVSSNPFIDTTYNYIYGMNTFSNATVSRTSTGTLATFDINPDVEYPELHTMTSEIIEKYKNVKLSAYAYGFTYYPSGNGSAPVIKAMFDSNDYYLGGVSSLQGINPGKLYDTAPYVLVYEPLVAGYGLRDFIFEIQNSVLNFKIGERVTTPSGGIGIVKTVNSTYMTIRRIQFASPYIVGEVITGDSSGATATISSIAPDVYANVAGLNAVVSSNVITANGSVTSLTVYDSGFGYSNGENLTFTSSDGNRSGLAKVYLGKYGESEGFYENKNGQLSDNKFIFDGEYYQDYSYEISAAISPDKYKDMLKKILHVAGTKAFSTTTIYQNANTTISTSVEITQTV